MSRKIVLGITLTLLLVNMLTLGFNTMLGEGVGLGMRMCRFRI